jgi:hypothetical protein
MRVTPSLLVCTALSLWGLVGGHSFTWIPVSGLVASLLSIQTRDWCGSDQLGSLRTMSRLLKFALILVGAYALLSIPACVVLAIMWFTGK